ncbi:MAG: VWA domain-containing protein, partial [Pseudomonadota bacterium]
TNPVKVVKEEPVSTFSVDVDTASYSFMRASLNNNVLPQKNSVRVEELINYFDYGYEAPTDQAAPFMANVSIMPTPWNAGTKLLSIGIKGYELPKTEAPASNLVFLIDTSGSMNAPNKLPLLRNSFKLLLSSLRPDDTVSIVTYAGGAGTVLEPTRAADKNKILAALDNLHAGGSTAGAEGIRQAYKLAESSFKQEGVNRVILATDGDFNVGISNPEELKSYIERKRETGVTLSVLGFGQGNYNDQLMQALAQNGNGNASYIDTLSEARKVLVEEAGSTLFTIAKDVKLQVEFNPALVSEYRLIGYETRALKREDFNNDKVDAGDIGAGHTVTALYELTPANSDARLVDDLRYGNNRVEFAADASEYGFMKIRYKLPDSDTSTLITQAIDVGHEVQSVDAASTDSRFAASVAAFGQILRGGQYTRSYRYDDVIALARSGKGEDEFGYRAEFINLVRLAKSAAALQPLKQ